MCQSLGIIVWIYDKNTKVTEKISINVLKLYTKSFKLLLLFNTIFTITTSLKLPEIFYIVSGIGESYVTDILCNKKFLVTKANFLCEQD